MDFIDGILEADREAPRKQRHTAHRIWRRIREEKPESNVAEATVRRYVQRWKEELALKVRDIRSAIVRMGRRGAGGLVRSYRRTGWRTDHRARFLDA